MIFKLSNLDSNLALTLGYLNPALTAQVQSAWAINQRKKRGSVIYGMD